MSQPTASIHLLQYRNYTDATFDLGRHTFFVGPNGSGKTNIIEAIRTVSVTKSYRARSDRDAIAWDQTYCRVELNQGDETFEYILTQEEFGAHKLIKHNGIALPLAAVYGLLPTVLFSPETMQLIDGSPQERRRFLDTLLSQAETTYIEALLTYRKVMRERHFVLLRLQQGLGQDDELDFWDSELVKSGKVIMTMRHALIDQMNTFLTTIYPQFVDRPEKLVLRYKPACSPKDFAKRLAQARSYDTKTTTTSVGPHRDELVFLLDDRDVTLFASRGELRRCVLAIKMGEALYLKEIKAKEPLLLLDDVFSELDATRRQRLIQAITPYRSVITTTDASFITEHKLKNSLTHTLGL